MNIRRLAAVTGATVKMMRRDRTALFFAIAFPIVFMVLFGLIFGGSGSKPDLDVVGSGPLVVGLQRSHAVKLHPRADAATAIKRVHDGKESGALIYAGGKASLYFDASSVTQAPILRGIVEGIANRLSLPAGPPRVQVTEHSVDANQLDYIDFLVPGLLAMALSQSAVFGVAFSLVAFRQKGILRRLRLTPMPLSEFALGRIAGHLCIALSQAIVLLAVGRIFFGVKLVGNFFTLLPLVLLGATCFIAIGFLVGAVAPTEDSAAAIANLVTLPMTFLAGVFFPLDSAPAFLRDISRVLPLTYLANGLRDVSVRGHSFASTVPDLLVLASVALVVGLVALRSFRWNITA